MENIYNEILKAKDFLEGKIAKTPVLSAYNLSEKCEVLLKAENLQRTGSFKIRGAYYKISRLSEEEKRRGVIACSAGNHAQGVALAAQNEGIECTICMPEYAPISKIQKTKSYGANVILTGGCFDDTLAYTLELAQEKNYVFIHPFDDELIIAGQGTLGAEIIEQVPDADIVLVAVGGGGLASGVASYIKQANSNCKVYGVEAANAASMKKSMEANKRVQVEKTLTIADGISVGIPGKITYDICRQTLDGVITVSENQITSAMLKLLEDYKMLVEGAGAVSVASVMYDKLDFAGKKVICVLSGGNVDVNIVERIIAKGLKQTGRVMEFVTVISDKPGHLKKMLDIVGGQGANILSVSHDRADLNVDMDKCVVHLAFESQDQPHQQRVINALTENGYILSAL